MDKINNSVNWKRNPKILRVAPILFCVVFIGALYYSAFLKGYGIIKGCDALNLYVPNNYVLSNVLRHGKFPSWNPSINLGQPTLDGATLFFHPAIILYLFLSPLQAHTIEILLALALTILGIWYFLRMHNLGAPAAVIGSFVYVLSGPVLFLHPYHMSHMFGLLLPWCLIVFHIFDKTHDYKWIWVSSLLCLMASQSMDLDSLVYFYGGLVIDRIVSIPIEHRKNYLALWISILILTALSVVLYLPLMEWLRHSSRLLKDYSSVLAPDIKDAASAIISGMWSSPLKYDAYYFYFGPGTIWFILCGIFSGINNKYIFRYFRISLIIPFCYILMRFISWHFNYPVTLDLWRSMVIFCLSLSMVSAVGIKSILDSKRLWRRLNLFLGLIVFGWAMYITNNNSSNLIYRQSLFIGLAGVFISSCYDFKNRIANLLFRLCGIFLVAVPLLLLPAILRINAPDQYRWDPGTRPSYIQDSVLLGHDIESYGRLAEIFNNENDHGRVSFAPGTENIMILAGLRTVPNYTTCYNARFENRLCLDGLIRCGSDHPYWMRLIDMKAHQLALYGVRFVVTVDGWGPRPDESTSWIMRDDLSWEGHKVWENKYYIGRAYIVTGSGIVKSGVKFRQDDPDRVILEVNAEDGDKLVLADLVYPGWHVSVGGRKVAVETYHVCLRAVTLSKGRNVVEWTYNGRSQQIGIVLFVAILLCLIIFLFFAKGMVK